MTFFESIQFFWKEYEIFVMLCPITYSAQQKYSARCPSEPTFHSFLLFLRELLNHRIILLRTEFQSA